MLHRIDASARISRRAAWFPILLGLVLAMPALAQTAVSGTPKNLGAFEKWRALTATADGQRTCYAMSVPVEKQGNLAGRGEVAAMVTHFPEIGALDQVSVVLGFEPAANSPVIAKIGGFTFTLENIAADRAWVKSRVNDRAMVQALKKSNRMVVSASTARGLKVEDTYDLTGFTKAYQAMSKACS